MKRLIRKSEKEWIAYHTMPGQYLDEVLQNGKKPTEHFNHVYLAADKGLSSSYGMGAKGEDVILTVKMTEGNLDEIKQNNTDYSYDVFASEYVEGLSKYNIEEYYDADDFIDQVYDEYGSGEALKLEDEIFESYFYNAELIISEIKPEQIIEHEAI